jgi:hypothetical protein
MDSMTKGGATVEEICEVVNKLYCWAHEDFTPEHIEDQVLTFREIYLEDHPKSGMSIGHKVDEWMASNISTKGGTSSLLLSLQACYSDLGMKNPKDKAAIRMAFKRMIEKGRLEAVGNRSGMYRLIDNKIKFMDFMNADIENSIYIKLPLGIEHKTKFYPKAVIVLAGVSGMGKTLFSLNVVQENMERLPCYYFNSEMGPEALKKKLSYSPITIEQWGKGMKVIDDWDHNNIAYKIQPDALNVIDYLEPEGDKPYNIHGIISAIINKLNKGTALIAIQKKPGTKLGTGGIYSIKAASLALSLEWGTVEIVKNRVREEDPNPRLNKIDFEVLRGWSFQKNGKGWHD